MALGVFLRRSNTWTSHAERYTLYAGCGMVNHLPVYGLQHTQGSEDHKGTQEAIPTSMSEYFFWMAIQRSWMVPQQHCAFMMMSRSSDTTTSCSVITKKTAA
jgi:hypothetical protein